MKKKKSKKSGVSVPLRQQRRIMISSFSSPVVVISTGGEADGQHARAEENLFL
jgi:hypothetical protein